MFIEMNEKCIERNNNKYILNQHLGMFYHCNLPILKFSHCKDKYNSFSKFIELCNYHHNPIFNDFYLSVLLHAIRLYLTVQIEKIL